MPSSGSQSLSAPLARRHVQAALCLFALTATSCATGSEADALRDLPPAPLVVAVEWGSGGSAPVTVSYDGQTAQATAAEMGELLAQELRALDASSYVGTREDLADRDPDLTLVLEPRSNLEFAHVGTSNFLASGGLWLVTWIGGLLVDDSTYSIGMDAICRYSLDPEDYFERTLTGSEVDLSFFQRNDLLSMQGLQSLILPPFWTSDQTDKTSDALKRSAMRVAARQIAGELKTDYEQLAEDNLRCSIKLAKPAANGMVVTGMTMPIDMVIAATAASVLKVTASVNGGEPIILTHEDATGLKVRAFGNLTGLELDKDNWVRIVVSADIDYTRTLRLAARN